MKPEPRKELAAALEAAMKAALADPSTFAIGDGFSPNGCIVTPEDVDIDADAVLDGMLEEVSFGDIIEQAEDLGFDADACEAEMMTCGDGTYSPDVADGLEEAALEHIERNTQGYGGSTRGPTRTDNDLRHKSF